MKTHKATKLSLSRETLRTLGKDALDRVAGGVSGTPGCNCSLGMCDETKFLCVPTLQENVE